jgi:hypothetical protein
VSDDSLKNLKTKLDLLENKIRDLLKSTEEELKMARAVQSILMPNRLPKFHGLETFAKYISARELSSEFYDLIPSENNRILWILQSWTSNFGLASLVTQTFMNLQSQKILAANSKGEMETVFRELLQTVKQLNDSNTGNVRLMIRRLDMSRLSLESIGFGFPPPLVRSQEKNRWGSFQAESLDHYVKNPEIMHACAFSALDSLPIKKFKHSAQLKPGVRFFLMGASWNPTDSISEFFRDINLELNDGSMDESGSPLPTTDSKLLDDLNYLVLELQRALNKKRLKADICLQAFETDKKLLHLA